MAPIPFVLWLWKSMDAQAAEITPSAKVLSCVLDTVSTSSAGAASAGAAASSVPSATTEGAAEKAGAAASAVKRAGAKGAGTEIAAAAVAAAVAAGGAAYVYANRDPHIIYASSVVEATVGAENAEGVLGEPDFDEEYEGTTVSMGRNGELVLSFDEKFTNLDGVDIIVYEIGNVPEETDVYVSADLSEWYYVGTAEGKTYELDMDGYVPEGVYFKYIKLVDLDTYYTMDNKKGADIDAVGVYVMQ